MNAFVNGEQIEQPETKVVTEEDLNNLRKTLFDSELNNLDYVDTALKLRKALIDNGQADPFLPVGSQISPTAEDVAAANRVADVMQACIDYADGDSELFTQELQRRTVDVKVRR